MSGLPYELINILIFFILVLDPGKKTHVPGTVSEMKLRNVNLSMMMQCKFWSV